MKNNDWIDQSKGIAIILVVLGHAILGFQSSSMFTEYNHVFDYINFTIYSFHMPLFFMISGYTYSKFEKVKNSKEYKNLITKKALNLLIPYFVFCSIQILIKSILSGSTNQTVSIKDIVLLPIIPQEQFWFLYTLFFIFIIVVFMDIKINKKIVILITLVLLNLVEIHMTNIVFAITSVCAYAIYFYIGILIYQKSDNKILELKNKYILLINVILYIMINIFVYNTDLNVDLERLLSLVMATLGSFIIISITRLKLNNKYINFIGRYSYEIFLLHTIFGSGIRIILLKIFKIQNIGIHFTLAIVFGIAIPIIIAKIAKKIKLIDFLFKPYKYINKYQKTIKENNHAG